MDPAHAGLLNNTKNFISICSYTNEMVVRRLLLTMVYYKYSIQLFFILSDLTNSTRSLSYNSNTNQNLKKLLVNNNGKILNLRIEDLHIPRGVLFRNPFIKNDFFPQDTDNLFLFFYQATL